MSKTKILVFVESERWMRYLTKMFHEMLGRENINKEYIRKDSALIVTEKFKVDIQIGLRQSSRGAKADLTLNLIRNQDGLSLEDIQEIHRTVAMATMSSSRYVKSGIEEDKNNDSKS